MRGRSAMAGVALTSVTALVLACAAHAAECDGFLINDGQRLFPLGFFVLMGAIIAGRRLRRNVFRQSRLR